MEEDEKRRVSNFLSTELATLQRVEETIVEILYVQFIQANQNQRNRLYFVENEEFALRHLVVDTNGELDAEHFIEVSGITPGSSVFALNLRETEERLLRRPSVEKVYLSRRLPGSLRVRIEEREPVAWLECRPLGIIGKHPVAGILLDKNGVCFPCESWWQERARELPVVLVSQVQDGDITVGKEIRHYQARKALSLLKASQDEFKGTPGPCL